MLPRSVVQGRPGRQARSKRWRRLDSRGGVRQRATGLLRTRLWRELARGFPVPQRSGGDVCSRRAQACVLAGEGCGDAYHPTLPPWGKAVAWRAWLARRRPDDATRQLAWEDHFKTLEIGQ